MLCMQASIGAVNDLADVELDRVGKPAKPIVAGSVSLVAARTWAALTGLLTLVLATPSGPATVGIGIAAIGLGYLYDLRLSRTALSWLPLSLALPLVPAFAWVGATGGLPGDVLALLPAAFLAGAALMTANGLVDIERDAAGSKRTVAVRLGREAAWGLNASAFAAAVTLALVLAPAPGGPSGTATGDAGGLATALGLVRLVGLPLGAVLIAAGAILLRATSPAIRERGWELEAAGTAVLGMAWLAGTAALSGVATGQ